MRNLRIIGLFLATVLAYTAQAQEGKEGKWEKEGEGEIKDVEIEIVKDRNIILPQANRNFGKVPPRPYEPIKPAITYDLRRFTFTAPAYTPVVRPLRVKQEELPKLNGNYLSAGVGNYGSFMVEGDISTKRDKTKYVGAHFYTRYFGSGPVNGQNSSSNQTSLQAYGKWAGPSLTTSAEAGYENRASGYYGGFIPETNRDRIRQHYDRLFAGVVLNNTKQEDFNYEGAVNVSYLRDKYTATELLATASLQSNYKLNEKGLILFEGDYFLINRKDSLIPSVARHLLRVKPAYRFSPVEKLVLTLGLNLAFHNDTYPGSSSFRFYPNVKAEYALSTAWQAGAWLTGDMDRVDLHTLSRENPWIDRNASLQHTDRALEAGLRLQGKPGSKWVVSAGASAAILKNYYFYLAGFTPADNRFLVVYDNSTTRTNPWLEITWKASTRFTFRLRGDAYSYNTNQQAAAWNRPTYRADAGVRYNLYEKIVLEAGYTAMGGMKGSLTGLGVPAELNLYTLPNAGDLYFKGRYFFSKQVSAFVQANNLLNNSYPLLQNYPARGTQIMAGASWSF